MKLTAIAALACAGLASGALGQGAAEWVLLPGSGTADGDFDIEEPLFENSIVYKLGLDLKPSPGETLGDGSRVVGFGSVITNIIGKGNWALPSDGLTWTVNPDLVFLTGDLSEFDEETHDLTNINAGQVPGFGPFSSADPIWVVTLEWSTSEFSERTVTALVDTQDDDTIQAFVRRLGSEIDEAQTWPLPDFELQHEVTTIPAPHTALVPALFALGIARRRG